LCSYQVTAAAAHEQDIYEENQFANGHLKLPLYSDIPVIELSEIGAEMNFGGTNNSQSYLSLNCQSCH
jgi:hypothetical protein